MTTATQKRMNCNTTGSTRLGACDPPCLLLCDLVESRREEGRVAERALLILVIWDKAAVAGPTVIEASSSIIVSICIHAQLFCNFQTHQSITIQTQLVSQMWISNVDLFVTWNEVALAGPTVIEASSSIIVSICIHAQFVLCIPITASH